MATNDCYVSTTSGSDSTGDGSASNPYKTIGKAIGSSPAFGLSGSMENRLIVEPGVYRELIALGVSPTSAGPLTIIGDCDGSLFAAAGGGGLTGAVDVRGWSDDSTPLTTGPVLSASGKSYVAVQRIKFISGDGSGNGCVELTGAYSDWSFVDCGFSGSKARGVSIALTATAGSALNVTFDRCAMIGVMNTSTYYMVQIRAPLAASEYSLNVAFRNSLFMGGAGAIQHAQVGGSGSGWATGVTVQQCTFAFGYRGLFVANTPSLTTPIASYGSAYLYCTTGISAATSGQIIEDGNVFCECPTPLNNVTAGTHSIQTAAPAFSTHDERAAGSNPRPFFEPSPVSPLLGAGGWGSPPAVDMWSKTRPVSPGSGALERDTFATPANTYIFNTES